VKEPHTQVFLNLSQPDLRFTLRRNPETIRTMNRNYEAIGVYILKTDDPNFKKVTYRMEDKAAAGPFTDIRDLSFEFTCKEPGNYVLLPCTFNKGVETIYALSVYANKPADLAELAATKPAKSLNGEWKGKTAGGCINYKGSTWMNNPQFLLVCGKPGPVDILLTQIVPPGKEPEAITVYVFASSSESRIDEPEQLIIKPKEIGDDITISAVLDAEAHQGYIIMPTLFDPEIERQFTLTVASADDKVQVFKLL